MEFKELDVVKLKHARPADGLEVGAEGTIVMIYASDAFHVEFLDEEGDTVALLILPPSELELSWRSPETAG